MAESSSLFCAPTHPTSNLKHRPQTPGLAQDPRPPNYEPKSRVEFPSGIHTPFFGEVGTFGGNNTSVRNTSVRTSDGHRARSPWLQKIREGKKRHLVLINTPPEELMDGHVSVKGRNGGKSAHRSGCFRYMKCLDGPNHIRFGPSMLDTRENLETMSHHPHSFVRSATKRIPLAQPSLGPQF